MAENVSTTGSLDEDALAKAILAYRNTPCPFTRASPAMLLFGRPVRDMIPIPLVPSRSTILGKNYSIIVNVL